MIFQNPQILALLLLLLPAAWIMHSGSRKTARILAHFSGNAVSVSPVQSLAIQVLSLVLLASLLIVAAGPQRNLPRPDSSRSGKYVFLLDVSRSMAARASCDESMQLDRARSLMTNIIQTLPEAEIAFVPFTELTFPFTELSFDRQYLQEVINYGLFVESVPTPGSDIANALIVVAEKKTAQPPVYADIGHIILISDGDISEEANQQLVGTVPVLAQAGIKVISVGVGPAEGLPIPTLGAERECLEGQFERAEGKEFYTQLFPRPLQAIAEQTGGRYFAESEQNDLINYLRSTLVESPELHLPVQTQDISPLFLLIITLSLFGLVYLRRF